MEQLVKEKLNLISSTAQSVAAPAGVCQKPGTAGATCSKPPPKKEEDDDDVDLFGSESEVRVSSFGSLLLRYFPIYKSFSRCFRRKPRKRKKSKKRDLPLTPPRSPKVSIDKEKVTVNEHAKRANVLWPRFSEPVLIAKSNIILDVKPWDDETNMKELEEHVRKVTMDGLVWGACKC